MKYERKPVQTPRGHRAKEMLPAIKQLIAMRSVTNPYKTSDGQRITDRQIIAEKLIDEIKEKFPAEMSPAEDTLVRMISSARNQDGSPLDEPWNLGTIEDYPLLSADIAAIIEVQSWLELTKDDPGNPTSGVKQWTEYYSNNKMTTTIWPLTIRDALWLAKLYKVNYNLSDPEKLYLKLYKRPIVARRTLLESLAMLWQVAKTYADYQRLCELAGTDFDTTKLDNALRSGSIGKTKLDLFSEYKSKSDKHDIR
jgi:hypothetical protein